MSWVLGPQKLDWVSPSREFATTIDLFNSQPNYEHEVAIALDTRTKYQGIAPVVGGWRYATGEPGPFPFPSDPPAVNDEFTKVLLEFEGIERSHTFPDTNKGAWPKVWTKLTGFGGVTNVNELFDDGALFLDGQTVIVAPDRRDFYLRDNDFTIRGYFLCDFPLGEHRVLVAKTNMEPILGFAYWVDRIGTGQITVAIGINKEFNHRLLDRFANEIIDRFGNNITTNFDFISGGDNRIMMSDTIFSDTINPGWHEFEFTRKGSIMRLEIDGTEEDQLGIDIERVMRVPGPFTIGGYGPPMSGHFMGTPWKGGLDRFAIDFGIAR